MRLTAVRRIGRQGVCVAENSRTLWLTLKCILRNIQAHVLPASCTLACPDRASVAYSVAELGLKVNTLRTYLYMHAMCTCKKH
jgi:hypothetical protein